jgi:hypothetical protein
MKIITKTEAQEWCRSNSIVLDHFNRPKANCETEDFDIPSDAGQRVAMVANQFQIFENEDELLYGLSAVLKEQTTLNIFSIGSVLMLNIHCQG